MNRTQLRQLIEARLGGRQLVWFGTRGDDAAGLEDLEQLRAVFSIVGLYDRRPDVRSYTLEENSEVRVDLDAHDIDDDPHALPVEKLRRELLNTLAVPSAVATYRPSTFLNGVTFARAATTEHLGMFKEHQFAFEHKPWVERSLENHDLHQLDWHYYSDLDLQRVALQLDRGPIVLRRSRSSGGTGVARVDDVDTLRRVWPQEPGGFVAMAPFLDDALPVNIGAVVWDDGITIHWPSVQLIGMPELTDREFGFCGNDFALARSLSATTLGEMERATRVVGHWLSGLGYRGAFGVDYLVKDDVPIFMEVNPRFQGSSRASSILSRDRGESCVFLDHLAAHLQLASYEQEPLAERVPSVSDLAHLVQHWRGPSADGPGGGELVAPLCDLPGFSHADVLVPSKLARHVGAPVYRATFRRSVTSSGFELAPDIAAAAELSLPHKEATWLASH